MVKQHIKKITFWIEKNGFPLLLLSTFLVLTLTPFTGDGVLSDIMLMITMSFLFIQSMSAENVNKSQKRILRIVVFILIVVTWFRPMGIDANVKKRTNMLLVLILNFFPLADLVLILDTRVSILI